MTTRAHTNNMNGDPLPAETLAQAIYDKCSPTGTPATHAPCVVLIVHPLLAGAALARELVVHSNGLMVQSAGHTSIESPPALADTLFEHLLAQAGLMRLNSSSNHDMGVDAVQHYLSLAAPAVQHVMATGAARVEQLAARLAITDAGMQVASAHTYLALCTRNSVELSRSIKRVQNDFAVHHLDSRQPEDEYPREYYDDDNGVEAPPVTTVKMNLDPRMAVHQQSLACTRVWTNNVHGVVQQIEVLVGDWCLDAALIEHCCVAQHRDAVAAPVMRAQHRAEALLRTKMYDARNTLYVVVSVDANYVRMALASIHQWMERNYAGLGVDLRCDVMTRLAAAVTSVWDRAKTLVPAQSAPSPVHRLSVELTATPLVTQTTQNAPSRYLIVRDEWRAISVACIQALVDLMTQTRYTPGETTTLDVVMGTRGRLMASVCADTPTHKKLVVCSSVAMSVAVEDVADAFRRLFSLDYVHGEFHTNLECRPGTTVAAADHTGYVDIDDDDDADSISTRRSGSCLLEPFDDDDDVDPNPLDLMFQEQ